MNETYQDLENQAIKDKNRMKTFYLEITKKRGNPQIDKITTDSEHRAILKANSLMKANPNILKIKIVEVETMKYGSSIAR